MWAVALLVLVACAAGIPVRSSPSGQTDVDEPQYLMTAQSIWRDGDVDIANQLAEESWRDFHRPGTIGRQTQPRADGSALSPHDPLLPVLLAVPVGLFGWVGAKLFLALVAAYLAALTLWVGVRRLGLALRPTAVVVGLAGATSPLAVYGQQVYPEIVAALAVVVAVALVTGTASTGRAVGVVLALSALPWLSVKYAPVAVALGLAAAVTMGRRRDRPGLAVLGVGAALMTGGYLLVHRLVYGGWTVYAAGDEFQRNGEFSVVGFAPDYPARSVRLLGLVIDADFGLAAWQPAALVVFGAVVFVAHRGLPHRLVLLLPLAAGWLTATYIAITMQGYWWPGRQLVVVLPLAVLCTAGWIGRLGTRARIAWLVAGLWGSGIYATVLVAGLRGRATWVEGPLDASLHPVWSTVLPNLRVLAGAVPGSEPSEILRYVVWSLVAVAIAVWGWCSAATRTHEVATATPRSTDRVAD